MKQTPLSISISADDWQALKLGLFTDDKKENAAVLLCGVSDFHGERRLLTKRVVLVPDELYIERLAYHLEISPKFYNLIVSECLRNGTHPVIVHSHPMNTDAWYSSSDDSGESRLLPVLQSLIPGSTPASLVVTPIDVTGRYIADAEFHKIKDLKIIGSRSETKIVAGIQKLSSKISEQYDRQVRAFGAESQEELQNLRIAIVGVGGTGSLSAEQLVRAGVRDLVLVDFDRVEQSNVNRLFGSTVADVGKQKATVVASALKALGGDKIKEIRDSAIKQSVLMELRDRDLILSCVDNDRTRAFLNRFAYQYLIPIIDMGIRLDGREGNIKAAAGRVSVVGPGMLCLRCSHHLNPERIRAESLPDSERQKLQKEGYIMGITEPAPAVVSLNTVISGLAVTAALNMFVNLTGGTQPLDQLYDATTGTVFTTNAHHETDCDICDPVRGVKGLGDRQIVSAY